MKVEGVGVMKDKELKFEETESSHTPVYTRWIGGRSCQRNREEEGVDATLLSDTLRYISLANLARGWGLFR